MKKHLKDILINIYFCNIRIAYAITGKQFKITPKCRLYIFNNPMNKPEVQYLDMLSTPGLPLFIADTPKNVQNTYGLPAKMYFYDYTSPRDFIEISEIPETIEKTIDWYTLIGYNKTQSTAYYIKSFFIFTPDKPNPFAGVEVPNTLPEEFFKDEEK